MVVPPDHPLFRGLFMIVHYKTSHKSHKWGLTHIYGHLYIIHKWGITWYYHHYGRLPLIYTVTIYCHLWAIHASAFPRASDRVELLEEVTQPLSLGKIWWSPLVMFSLGYLKKNCDVCWFILRYIYHTPHRIHRIDQLRVIASGGPPSYGDTESLQRDSTGMIFTIFRSNKNLFISTVMAIYQL